MESGVRSQESGVRSQESGVRSQESGVRSRIVGLDFVKGVTIFLVVFGHCIQYGNGKEYLSSGAFFDDILFKIIYSFHMPLFALVSGYLFYWSVSSRSPREVLIRQANILVLPAVSWSILYQTAMAAFHIYRGDFDGVGVTLQRMYYGIYSLWFLWAMFYASVIVLIVREKFRDSIKIYVLVSLLLTVSPNRFADSLYVFMFPYFAAGYLWHREGMDKKFSCANHKLLCAGIILVWCIMLLFYDRSSYIYTTGAKLIKYREGIFVPFQLLTDIFRWCIGFAGCGAVLIFLKLIKPVKFIAALGVKTLGIYIISGYVFSLYMLHQEFPAAVYIMNFIQAVIITAVSYALSEGISRVKILNKIFFGGR